MINSNNSNSWSFGFNQSILNAAQNSSQKPNVSYGLSNFFSEVNTVAQGNMNDQISSTISWYDSFNQVSSKLVAAINATPITSYDENGNKIENYYNFDKNVQHVQTNYYDKTGKISKYTAYNADGSIKNNVDRTYNADGSFKDSVKDASGKHTGDIYYNAAGKMIQSSAFGTDGKKTQDNFYNTDGKLKDSVAYNADGTKVDTIVDANGVKTQDKVYDKAGKLTTSTVYNTDGSKVVTSYKANGDKNKDEYYDKAGKLTNKVLYSKGDAGYGSINWNSGGATTVGDGYDNYIARHGDFDNFFTSFGKYWQLPDLESIVNNSDNTSKDKDARVGFVSNGIVTAHKISATQIGFNVTAKDMSKKAGFNYNYVVWDKSQNSYIVGTDKNNDGNLTGDEISGIVTNVGNKTSSPLTFDLNGDGVKTSDKLIQYDINGDGTEDTINDVNDATLCIRGGNSGKDLFGDNTDLDGDGKADGFANGFDALKALALKEGLINGKDDMKLDAKDISVLQRKYDLGMKTGGYNSQAKTLSDLGITEIDLGSTDNVDVENNFDGQGNILMQQAGATFKVNGADREYADVWHLLK